MRELRNPLNLNGFLTSAANLPAIYQIEKIFSVADAFLMKPVALPNLENLVVPMERAPHQTANWTSVSPANYQFLLDSFGHEHD
jgi:hypothetical protein